MNPLVSALLDLAVRITKWIVRRLAQWSLKRVVTWMRTKVRTFKGRWDAARIERNEKRMGWLEGRIERWTRAANWIEENAMKALGTAARDVCKLKAFRKLPDYASCEKLAA
jgi:hypothetical protein